MIKFSDLNLSEDTLNALERIGVDTPTPIQSMAIPPTLKGKDVIGQAQTGTGKTFAYILPAIENIEGEGLQVLVLCPTRELALQVTGEFKKFIDSQSVVTVYGGQEISYQIKAIKKSKVVVGTPGRLIDHIHRKSIKLNSVKMVVIDEADEMLNMGFIEDVGTILGEVPSQRQTLLFSATMPKPIIELTKKFQKDPVFIKVPSKELTVSGIHQHYFNVKERDKNELLFRILDIYDPQSAMIFCNTKKAVDDLTVALKENNYLADAIHGDIKQFQRDKVMNAFKSKNVRILVATDVAARGLDIKDVEIVVNYDLPNYNEYYVHRIGRTGRMGKTGIAFTFVTSRETYKLREIEKYAGKIEKLEIPSIEDVENRSKSVLVNKIKEELMGDGYKRYIENAKILVDEFSEIEVVAALLKMNEKNFRKREFKAIEKIRDGRKDDFKKRYGMRNKR
ncbi:MAG: ATP-dependent RNA helicase [Mesoaciditoga sp.]|nr:MAG: ATP-dependent RNA helicase [Mesoaciditoga sp.]PMP79126.1 MAG: ATP-dependent RNA helicase [Mesoaciditoga sp.]HEU24582.1 DEAD/DEAH box helicase [Mesoaciditoga lauensis]